MRTNTLLPGPKAILLLAVVGLLLAGSKPTEQA
jgi:chromate transport protein ChrA